MQKDYGEEDPIEEMCTSERIFWAAIVVAWGVSLGLIIGRWF